MTTNGRTIAATRRLTAEQFAVECADAEFCELEGGAVVRREAGDWCSSLVCTRTAWLLGNWASQTGAGRVLINLGVITARNPDTARGPDVAFFDFERVPRGQEPESFAEVPPNLAVEVPGKGQRLTTMTEKVREYLGMGMERAWIVDPQRRTLHVSSPDQPPLADAGSERVSDEDDSPGFSCQALDFFSEYEGEHRSATTPKAAALRRSAAGTASGSGTHALSNYPPPSAARGHAVPCPPCHYRMRNFKN